MGRRTKIITEYRQTGGDGDADGYKIFYSVILYSVEQSTSPHAVTKDLSREKLKQFLFHSAY